MTKERQEKYPNLLPPVRDGKNDPRSSNGGKGNKGMRAWKYIYADLLKLSPDDFFKKLDVKNNPSKTIKRLYKQYKETGSMQEAVAISALAEAMKGKISAIENLQDRTEGKVAQKVEVEGTVSQVQNIKERLDQLPPEKLAAALESFNHLLSAEIVDVATKIKGGEKSDSDE